MYDMKSDMQELQNKIIKSLQQASKLMMTSSTSENTLNDMMDDLLFSLETAESPIMLNPI